MVPGVLPRLADLPVLGLLALQLASKEMDAMASSVAFMVIWLNLPALAGLLVLGRSTWETDLHVA